VFGLLTYPYRHVLGDAVHVPVAAAARGRAARAVARLFGAPALIRGR
jgi:hypothetical protein